MKDKYLLLDYLPLSMLPSEVGGERDGEGGGDIFRTVSQVSS
jgi:hypothetical protein